MGTFDAESLRSSISGRVITAADGTYDAVRQVFYGGIDRRPEVIVMPAGAEDIGLALAAGRRAGLDIAVRGGGHSVAGYSSADGGMVIDLRDMKNIAVNNGARTVSAGAGATASEVTNAADQYGLAIGFGDTGSVGIGGITLGGGIGFLVRKFGMTIDNLLSAELVTADGMMILADSTHNTDLFWAVRGGGGNFGIVTSFTYRLQPLPNAYGGMLLLPATPDVLAGFLEAAGKAADELSAVVNVMPVPPMPIVPEQHIGQLGVMAFVMYAGDTESGMKAVEPLRKLAAPWADTVRPMSYREIFSPEDTSYHPTAVSHTMMTDHIDTSVAENLVAGLKASDAPVRVVQLRTLGGAMARVPEDATAFAHRRSKILANVAAFYATPEEQRVRSAWVRVMTGILNQGDDGLYVGFMGRDDEGRVTDAYPRATFDRLRQVKRRYDPDNVFHNNLNIRP